MIRPKSAAAASRSAGEGPVDRPAPFPSSPVNRRIFSGEPQRFGHRHFASELHRVNRGAGAEEHGLPVLRHARPKLDRVEPACPSEARRAG